MVILDTPRGGVSVSCEGETIKSIELRPINLSECSKSQDLAPPNSPFGIFVRDQFLQYFMGNLKKFDFKLDLNGTKFQLSVWRALQNIPYGSTCSYSDIANAIGQPNAVRAVGQANNRNKFPIVIPCHRVIAKDGSLGGFAMGTLYKQTLLNLEKSQKIKNVQSRLGRVTFPNATYGRLHR